MKVDGQAQMKAVVTTGFGGLEKLEYRENVPIPNLLSNEVLVKVGACGVNNTDIWTREGAYGVSSESGWRTGSVPFPRIQGADIAGQIVAVGDALDTARIGDRVLINPTIYEGVGDASIYQSTFIGSERDGGFAEFVAVPSENAISIQSNLSDAQLSTFMVSYLTAEHMLNRGNVDRGQTLLVTGASGGVGSALIQLAKHRGAKLICIVGKGKEKQARELGADFIIHRDSPIKPALEAVHIGQVDVVLDVVAGPQVMELIDILRPGGSFVIAGAIAGPETNVDWRMVYLKYLNICGSTLGTMEEARAIVKYIEERSITPLLHQVYPLRDIAIAQRDFLDKKFFGKLSIIPSEKMTT